MSASASQPSLTGSTGGGSPPGVGRESVGGRLAQSSEMLEARRNEERMRGARLTGSAEAMAQAEFKQAVHN